MQRRHYAATVTRLSILWAAICGVVEIVGMLERREELLKVSNTKTSPTVGVPLAGSTVSDRLSSPSK